jgi:hypothetical protein
MKKVYIPFNMIIDTDFGLIRLLEKTQNLKQFSVNKLKSFLIKRNSVNPITDYRKITNVNISDAAYDRVLDKYYDKVLLESTVTDLIAFVINTHKLGLTDELSIVVGCDFQSEIDFLDKISTSIEYNIETCLTEETDLNEYDYIFIKHFDECYIDYLINVVKLKAKRIYVADYNFNKIYENGEYIFDPELHLLLNSEGNILSSVTLYNKKPGGK